MPHFECGGFNHSPTSPVPVGCEQNEACNPPDRTVQALVTVTGTAPGLAGAKTYRTPQYQAPSRAPDGPVRYGRGGSERQAA